MQVEPPLPPRPSDVPADLEPVELGDRPLHGLLLRDVVFTQCRLDLASLRFATLTRVAFRDCRLEEADFHGATLLSVSFERCALREANLHAASFSRCELRECNLERLEGAGSLAGVRMTWPDVLGIADRLAEAIGIAIVE